MLNSYFERGVCVGRGEKTLSPSFSTLQYLKGGVALCLLELTMWLIGVKQVATKNTTLSVKSGAGGSPGSIPKFPRAIFFA